MVFGSSICTVSGNIPSADWDKITKIADSVFDLVGRLVNEGRFDRRIVRLLHPVNALVILDPVSIHYVFSDKGVGGLPRVTHRDFRTVGPIGLAMAMNLAQRDLAYEDCFGFSIGAERMQREELTEEDLLVFVEQYYESELLRNERLAREVRIDPIFHARNVLINKDECFVLMPFEEQHSLQEIYVDHIKPTIERAGLRCVRADDIYSPEPIVETIWEGILRAGVIVAELTGKNPNVFYELGIAHTVGKSVVLLSQNIDDVPFDLRHLRTILYEPTPRGVDRLRKQLSAMLVAIQKKG